MRDQSSTAIHKLSIALLGLWTALWLGANLLWLQQDRILRDGDEEGHVGAAELFREDLRGGQLLSFLERAFVGDMGDYPSLYPAVLGGWWWASGAGEPGVASVRALGLLWVLLAALATARIATRSGRPGAASLAFLATTLLPLPVGLARHFMPEGMLVAAVPLALWAAMRLGERPGLGRSLVLGLALGLGLLIKQTFLLLVLPGLAFILLAARPPLRALLPALLLSAGLAGPWTLAHLAEQARYGVDSALASGEGAAWAHLLYYPAALALLVCGPVLGLAALGALPGLRACRARRLALAWLLGGLLLLTLLPKKYPRLAAPLAPAIALLAGVGLAGRRPGVSAAGLALAGGAWLGWRSLSPGLSLPPPLQEVVPGCPQHWLRAPIDDDLGIAAAAELLVRAPPGAVRVLDGPEIPCSIQTTAPWAEHLGPALRRRGQDREVRTSPDEGAATLELRWLEGPPDPDTPSVESRALGGHFRLHSLRN